MSLYVFGCRFVSRPRFPKERSKMVSACTRNEMRVRLSRILLRHISDPARFIALFTFFSDGGGKGFSMVKCPRCEQLVDEMVRTTCPLCFTPITADPNAPASPQVSAAPEADPAVPGVAPMTLNSQAAPPPRPGSQTAGGRVSLMGEIIPDDPAAPQSFTGANVQQMKDPRATLSDQNFEEAETSNRRKNLISYLMFFVVVFGGGGYYWWYGHRTNPQDQLKKYIEATKNLDYKRMYELTALTDEQKKSIPDADAFQGQAKSAASVVGGEGALKKLLSGMTLVSVSEPKTDDKGATKVEAKLNFSFGGQTFPVNRTVEMKNEGGLWKVVGEPGAFAKLDGIQ